MRTLADYTARDVTPESRADYATHVERWQTELHPNGELELHFAAEITRAAWRLEHYTPLGPIENIDEAQSIWHRHRERTSHSIRRNLQELRRIQSDRYLQSHLGILLPGTASLRIILPGLKLPQNRPNEAPETETQPQKVTLANVAASEALLHAEIEQEERRQIAEFHKSNPDQAPVEQKDPPVPHPNKPAAPRNAPCPCNSGKKYKHCCGHWSKTMHKQGNSGDSGRPGLFA